MVEKKRQLHVRNNLAEVREQTIYIEEQLGEHEPTNTIVEQANKVNIKNNITEEQFVQFNIGS
jgi:hypothetical protein